MTISNFYQGTTKVFSGTISFNAAAPNISGDGVKFLMKKELTDTDANAAINSAANVATAGASGIYTVTLSKAVTDIPVGIYHYEIIWTLASTAEYVLEQDVVTVLERVEDV